MSQSGEGPPGGATAAPQPKAKRRRRWLRMTLAGVALALVVAVSWLAIRLYPWIQLPPQPEAEIEQGWASVIEACGPEPAQQGDEHLLEAVKVLKGTKRRFQKGPLTPLAPNELDESEAEALTHLRSWHASGGRVVPLACGVSQFTDDRSYLRGRLALLALPLAELALRAARDKEALEDVRAVMRLSRTMRDSGDMLLVSVGFSLSTRSVDWFIEREVGMAAGLSGKAPAVDQVARAIARSRRCTDQMFESPSLLGFSRLKQGMRPDPWPPLGLVRTRRERLLNRWYAVQVLHPRPQFLSELARRIDVATEAERSSVLLGTGLYAERLLVRRAQEAADPYARVPPR